jgi:hypothetical protein
MSSYSSAVSEDVVPQGCITTFSILPLHKHPTNIIIAVPMYNNYVKEEIKTAEHFFIYS